MSVLIPLAADNDFIRIQLKIVIVGGFLNRIVTGVVVSALAGAGFNHVRHHHLYPDNKLGSRATEGAEFVVSEITNRHGCSG